MNAVIVGFLFLCTGLLVGGALGWALHALRHPGSASDQLDHVAADLRADAAENTRIAGAELSTKVHDTLAPLSQAVGALTGHLHRMEVERAETSAQLTAQIQAMNRTSAQLTDRTGKLVTALRAPHVRGRWGEMQLQRVVELAGMVQHCDFDTQVGTNGVRPDMVVRLSDGRNIIVDAKAPFVAYLDALETEDPEEHAAYLRRHANHLRSHVMQLASKDYQRSFSPTPEFVVLFVPADPFLDAALQNDPELLEDAFAKDVLLTTPTTLIALLKTVALGWQHGKLSEQAAQIQELGTELYQRLLTLSSHMDELRAGLERSVEAYNSTLASMESRLFVTARKLERMEVLPRAQRTGAHADPAYIDATVRAPRHLE